MKSGKFFGGENPIPNHCPYVKAEALVAQPADVGPQPPGARSIPSSKRPYTPLQIGASQWGTFLLKKTHSWGSNPVSVNPLGGGVKFSFVVNFSRRKKSGLRRLEGFLMGHE